MDYFITLNEKSIDAIGEAVEKPITVIESLKEDIADLEQTVAEKQAIIDAFPTIESKNITANGTYSEEGKAYSPVVVNVPAPVPTPTYKFLKLTTVNNKSENVTCNAFGEDIRHGMSGTSFNIASGNSQVNRTLYTYPPSLSIFYEISAANVAFEKSYSGITYTCTTDTAKGVTLLAINVPDDIPSNSTIGTITIYND